MDHFNIMAHPTPHRLVEYLVLCLILVLTPDFGLCGIEQETKTFSPGDEFKLTCEAGEPPDNPDAKVGWAMDKEDGPLQYIGSKYRKKNPRYQVDEDGALTIDQLTEDDTGTYFCVSADKSMKYIFDVVIAADEDQLQIGVEKVEKEKAELAPGENKYDKYVGAGLENFKGKDQGKKNKGTQKQQKVEDDGWEKNNENGEKKRSSSKKRKSSKKISSPKNKRHKKKRKRTKESELSKET